MITITTLRTSQPVTHRMMSGMLNMNDAFMFVTEVMS